MIKYQLQSVAPSLLTNVVLCSTATVLINFFVGKNPEYIELTPEMIYLNVYIYIYIYVLFNLQLLLSPIVFTLEVFHYLSIPLFGPPRKEF